MKIETIGKIFVITGVVLLTNSLRSPELADAMRKQYDLYVSIPWSVHGQNALSILCIAIGGPLMSVKRKIQ